MNKIERIKKLLIASYDGQSWHGPNITKTLASVPLEKISNRLPNSHSIIELVYHMTAWRKFVIEQVKENLDYRVSDEANFKSFPNPSQADWEEVLKALEDNQQAFLAALDVLDEARLYEQIPGRFYDLGFLIHSGMHHDLYHLGQIVLLKK
jgi:uncharacterized damage-inducible protein DinB